MLLQYFGFQEDPFGATPDPRSLYPSHTHREALASLEYGFHSNRGFTAMIAAPGMGKTTLLFRFLESIRDSARSVYIFDIDVQCGPREFVGYILRDIGITPGKSSAEMHVQLSDALITETRAGRKFVVVIDEAQNLSDLVLERVRLLSNFETSRGKLMQIVLSGQPQLSDKLMQPSLLQLRQRISTISRINPLSAEETVSYIDYRLTHAGYKGEPLFTIDALKLIAETTQGTPRVINNLCFNALSLCCALKSKQVDASMVSEVVGDLQLILRSREPVPSANGDNVEWPRKSERRERSTRLMKRWIPTGALLLVMCALIILGLTRLWFPQSRKRADERSLILKALPSPVVPPSLVYAGKAIETDPTPHTTPFEITVEPDQMLQDIAVKYLGSFNLKRLHQIQALNPKLTDPDHIEVGQKIRLPGPLPAPLVKHASPSPTKRNLR